jgi:hypothetical protein
MITDRYCGCRECALAKKEEDYATYTFMDSTFQLKSSHRLAMPSESSLSINVCVGFKEASVVTFENTTDIL